MLFGLVHVYYDGGRDMSLGDTHAPMAKACVNEVCLGCVNEVCLLTSLRPTLDASCIPCFIAHAVPYAIA